MRYIRNICFQSDVLVDMMDVVDQLKELGRQLDSLSKKFQDVSDDSYMDSVQISVNKISKTVTELESLPLPARAFGCLPESDEDDLDFNDDSDDKLLDESTDAALGGRTCQNIGQMQDANVDDDDDTGDETDASDVTVNYDDKQSKV